MGFTNANAAETKIKQVEQNSASTENHHPSAFAADLKENKGWDIYVHKIQYEYAGQDMEGNDIYNVTITYTVHWNPATGYNDVNVYVF